MSFYITTPIYYVNDVPHLGHAYTTIAADALARFHRMRGESTYLLTGTDEHGQKIEEAASRRGKAPQELADEVVVRFRQTWEMLGISHDDFIRTTEPRHKQVVEQMWRRMVDSGDIYLGSYDGWYCVSCEAFYPENQLEDAADGKKNSCPIHKAACTWVSEPSYFFRMSRYGEALARYIETHPEFVQPEAYRREVLSFVKSGLRDLSVSRTTFQWGIKVPDEPAHVVYVWIDALTNYISALGGFDSDAYQRYWPASCHLIGKDILRFHAVYWPCMLMSAKLPLPKTIYTHGWWTVRGEKISKSMPATRVDPNELAADLGADALRYFLLREVPLGGDGDFSYESLIGRYNSDLANDLGNLLNRSLTMTSKFTDGKVPPAHADIAARDHHAALADTARSVAAEAAAHFETFAPSRALESIWRLVRETNRYVDTCQPWSMAKNPAHRAELEHATHTYLESLFWSARMIAPVMPDKALQILAQLGLDDAVAAAALSRWPRAEAFGSELEVGLAVQRAEPLFPRIDEVQQTALLDKWIPADKKADSSATPAAASATKPPSTPQATGQTSSKRIAYDDFLRMELRVAVIVAAEPVPKTSKLLRLQVDVGEAAPRQVVAGLAEAYRPEQLIGRKVILVANLEPATIRGVESHGMILAAGERDILGLSSIDMDVPAGTRVR